MSCIKSEWVSPLSCASTVSSFRETQGKWIISGRMQFLKFIYFNQLEFHFKSKLRFSHKLIIFPLIKVLKLINYDPATITQLNENIRFYREDPSHFRCTSCQRDFKSKQNFDRRKNICGCTCRTTFVLDLVMFLEIRDETLMDRLILTLLSIRRRHWSDDWLVTLILDRLFSNSVNHHFRLFQTELMCNGNHYERLWEERCCKVKQITAPF